MICGHQNWIRPWIGLWIAEVTMKKYLKKYRKLEHLSPADANVSVALASGQRGS